MAFSTIGFLLVLLPVALAQPGTGPRRMVVVTAGSVPGHGNQEIVPLEKGVTKEVCVQDFGGGISVRCEGNNVRPAVSFYLNGERVQTETRAPYHIAGDFDNGGLTKVCPWTDFTPGTAAQVLRITCEYLNRNGVKKRFTRKLRILASDCAHI